MQGVALVAAAAAGGAVWRSMKTWRSVETVAALQRCRDTATSRLVICTARAAACDLALPRCLAMAQRNISTVSHLVTTCRYDASRQAGWAPDTPESSSSLLRRRFCQDTQGGRWLRFSVGPVVQVICVTNGGDDVTGIPAIVFTLKGAASKIVQSRL